MADPTITNLTAQFDITDSAGYSLSNTRFEDDHTSVFAASAGLVMQHTVSTSNELESDADCATPTWQTENNLTRDTAIARFGTSCAKCLRDTGNQSRFVLSSGLFVSNTEIVWFYDTGTSMTGSNHFSVFWAANSAGIPAIATGFGVDAPTNGSNYSYYNLSTNNWTDTNIIRSVGWKKITVRTGGAVSEEGGGGVFELYLDDVRIYNDPNQSQQLFRLVVNTPTANRTFYIDRIWHRLNGSFYELTSTAVFPKLQPATAWYWDTYTPTVKSAAPTNGYQSTGVTMEVQYSTDQGSNYGTNDSVYTDGLYRSLRPANVNDGFLSSGDGTEAQRMKATLTSSVSSTSSPRLEMVVVTWLDEQKKLFPFWHFTN